MKYLVYFFPLLVGACGSDGVTIFDPKPEEPSSKPLAVVMFPEETHDVRFGSGVNSAVGISAMSMAVCVSGDEKLTSIGNQNGEEVKIQIDTINSQEEFTKIVNRDSKLMITYAKKQGKEKLTSWLSNVGNASSETSYKSLKEYRLKRNAQYAFVQAEKKFLARNMDRSKINPVVLNYTHEEFWNNCGDSFISSVESGARAIGLLECESTSIENKAHIETLLKGSVGVFNSSGSVQFSQIVDQIEKGELGKCRILVEKKGGSGNISLKPGKFAESLIQYVENATPEMAKPISVGTSLYSTVTDLEFLPYWRNYKADADLYYSVLESKKIVIDRHIEKWNELEGLLILGDGLLDQDEFDILQKRQNVSSKKVADLVDDYLKCALTPLSASACGVAADDWGDDELL
jgi:hypothetical protein